MAHLWYLVQVQVRLQGCEFRSNVAPHTLVASHGDGFNEAQFYSDARMPVYMPDNVVPRFGHTCQLKAAPMDFFLGVDDAWLEDLRAVRAPPQQRSPITDHWWTDREILNCWVYL